MLFGAFSFRAGLLSVLSSCNSVYTHLNSVADGVRQSDNCSMSAPNVPSTPAINDQGFYAVLMPNRGRTRFLRGVVWLFLAFGTLGCVSVAVDVLSEYRARHNWPVAQGIVTAVEVRSNQDRPGNLSRRTNYWVEYEVRFAVPDEQCLTGTIFSDGALPCWGTGRTRATYSPTTANEWLSQYRLNSAVGILHDPGGPNVKIAGESSWLVYPWRGILAMAGWMAFFLMCLAMTQRRLQYLETLPEDYDASPPPSSQPPGPNDLIDLKLSKFPSPSFCCEKQQRAVALHNLCYLVDSPK
jgi:Protein of unknown function (DUF3592)